MTTPSKQSEQSFDKIPWLIWSIEHKVWWAANFRGYTTSQAHACRYTFKAAASICANEFSPSMNIPTEAMVPLFNEKENI